VNGSFYVYNVEPEIAQQLKLEAIYIICFHHLNTATVDPALPAQCEEWSDDYMEPFPALE